MDLVKGLVLGRDWAKSRPAHPNGHFYSPVVNTEEAGRSSSELWPEEPEVLGIDFNEEQHRDWLSNLFPKYFREYDYEESGDEENGDGSFFTQNSQFGWLDSRVLFALLRHWKPRRFIEIGSGFSSMLVMDVNRRFLGGRMHVTCIEPYPRRFLRDNAGALGQLVEKKVQQVDLAVFEDLQAGDVLFIDSSHVAKTGSDVNHIYFNILPRIRRGVKIHIHDTFLPDEYPRQWVIDENRSWNEQYLVRALLMFSERYEVEFGCAYAFRTMPDLVAKALSNPDGSVFGGASFWISSRER
ncbi:class I SAM-dependent methyltransferase [Dokdonella sp. MW10]|uniref:class I SAM-dependent methyltransferase n=1 Tax=Dokdonella sp. MW10 TaxID=2992926 RepID=UPI003F7EB23B